MVRDYILFGVAVACCIAAVAFYHEEMNNYIHFMGDNNQSTNSTDNFLFLLMGICFTFLLILNFKQMKKNQQNQEKREDK